MSGRIQWVDLGALSLPVGVSDGDSTLSGRPPAELLADGLRLQRLLAKGGADCTPDAAHALDEAGAGSGIGEAKELNGVRMEALQACLEFAGEKTLELRGVSGSVTLRLRESVLPHAVLEVRVDGSGLCFDLCVHRPEEWRVLSEGLQALAMTVGTALGMPIAIRLSCMVDGHVPRSAGWTPGETP